jgi:fumarate reductase subunit C
MTPRFKPDAATYRRPMTRWWSRNPWFLRYMIREGSAVFLSAYALLLLAGLACLASGPAAYDAWRALLATPASIILHWIALLLVAYHAATWFKVMPKTVPGLRTNPKWITIGGFAASLFLSALLLGWLAWRQA